MSHCHLSRDLLRAAADGRLPEGTAAEIALEHLAVRCPTCREELRRFLDWKEGRRAPGWAWRTAVALEHLLGRLPGELQRAERELRRARRDLRELRRLPPGERYSRMEAARTRFRGPYLAELLLAEARRCLPERPAAAGGWADAAYFAAFWAPAPRQEEGQDGGPDRSSGGEGDRRPWLAALEGRALAHLANAFRVEERLDLAEGAFALAWARLREGGATDLAAFAEVACLEASLDRARRRLSEAVSSIHFASLLYAVLEDLPALARCRLTRGTLYQAWGRPEDALGAAEAAEEALDRLGPGAEPRLRLAARHNRGFYLCDLGRFAEAEALLAESRSLYERFEDPWTRCRLAWLEGKIARGLGRDGEAEERFMAAREGFLAEGSAYDAALVSLELAVLYLDQARTSDVLALAREMAATFRRLKVHREALAAARLFARAAGAEAVTADLLHGLAAYLSEARTRPGLPFEPPA
ncbi:MAG TPA: hypothetical protein VLF66_05190 [Thermoanaerobaculia bacterium]|nr:hypothetical protein [Thermoanaerobaculia bacterium]